MLETLKPIPLNAEFSFRVDLPPEISNKSYIVFTARSRWSRPDPIDTRLYDIGFEILKIAPGDIQTFEVIINQYSSSRTSSYFGTD